MRRTKRRTKRRRAGETRRCSISRLPNNNLVIIRGRRKYITKNFEISPESENLVYAVANNPEDRRNCILVARYEDIRLKAIKKQYKIQKREQRDLSRKTRKHQN